MKLLKQIIFILVIFLKTGNLLSDNNLFNVNNIILEKKAKYSMKELANQAIEEAFNELLKKILLKEDITKISDLNISNVKELVKYYNISKNSEIKNNNISFNITFDKEKIHNLFYNKGISYSDISDKEFFILPVLLKDNKIFIFSNNYYYENWNKINKDNLLEFILPQENIEIIQEINKYRDRLFDLEFNLLFKEYLNKNIAIIIIDDNATINKKIYLKSRIQNKNISKNLNFKQDNFDEIILKIKDEIINLVKSKNLIDIQTPSFLNVKLLLNKNSNLILLKKKINTLDLVENIFVQEFNKNYVNIRIKYLGKLEIILNQLKKENIILQFVDDQWVIKTL